ncbi:hypothetical protein BOX30_11365 [Leptospirillum ferriphilum]|nr:hypothetical protein BOX30_11365 [Leptospirillum ferriphilum]
MGESKSISAELMKEDLGRISQVINFIGKIEPIASVNLGADHLGKSLDHGIDLMKRSGETKTGLDYVLVQTVVHSPRIFFDAINDAFIKSQVPLTTDSEKKNFTEFISGLKEFSFNDKNKFDCDVKNEALRIYTALLFTRDTFTIFFNLLPTLSRIQKLLTLQSVLLSESSHCSGKSHPAAIALQKARSEGLVPWKENQGALEDGPAVKLFQRLQPLMTEGYPVPPDFASFSQNYPSWDAFWQIAAWKAVRMEKAIEAVTRELLIEAWKCPEKPLLPAPPDPDMPLEPERLWDWVTEKEITKPGLPRGGIRPFAYGSGHPVAEILWDPVWDAEHERRSYTEEIPLTFPKDLHTFRCGIPVDVKKVREIIDHPWRWAAEEDLPDFSGLWGGFSRETERLFSGKETVGQTSEGKPITWKDIRSGAESIYKRGIGMLDHLAGVQEYYRPLRAIDPAEWRDVAERLKEENFPERSPVGN